MFKARLCTLAIACTIGFLGLSPRTAFAAETDTGSITLSEKDKNHDEKQDAFEEKINKAFDTWNALTKQQKDNIYTLLENELKAELKVMDKLAEYGVLDKEDTATIKNRMTENFNKAKERSEFPFGRPKSPKNSK